MKLVCITTKYNHYNVCPIEVGSTYEVKDNNRTWDDDHKMIYILIKRNVQMEFAKKCFIALEDLREKKINQILKK